MQSEFESQISAYHSRLEDRLREIDSECAAKGLFRSGPRIRMSQEAIGQSFLQLSKRLLAMTESQTNPELADAQVRQTLEKEYSRLRQRLSDIVESTGGGESVRGVADRLMDSLWRDVEALASIPRVARASTGSGQPRHLGAGVYEVPAGWPSDIPPEDYVSQDEHLGVSDSVEAEIVPHASRWTGVPSRAQRLRELHGQLDIAQAAIGYLIEELADTEGNGGPLLDSHADALECLRELHHALGELLSAVDRGALSDEMGEGFAAEIARYAGRAVEALRDDPARFVTGATIFAVLSACGLGDLGGFMASAAVSIRKAKPARE